VQNLSNQDLSPDQRRFIDDFSELLMQWNMPATAARVFSYLQLMPEPASLDDLAAALEVSKSNVCSAAKMLESHRIIRRTTERGSRRIRYAPSEDPGAPLRKHVELLARMSRMLRDMSASVATGGVRQRLEHLADFDRDLNEAMARVIHRT
jgi:hypothetical protein